MRVCHAILKYTKCVQSLHISEFADQPCQYLPYGPFPSFESYSTFVEQIIRRDAGTLLFIIYDQTIALDSPVQQGQDDSTRPERIAGLIAVLRSEALNRKTEIGHVTILPPFQRSHVTTHACVALARWVLDDLKLRRLQWQASALNQPSIDVALRLGMRKEGEIRWDRVLPPRADAGVEVPSWAAAGEKEAGRGMGRHTAMLAVGWDDWHDGVNELCSKLLERPLKHGRKLEVLT